MSNHHKQPAPQAPASNVEATKPQDAASEAKVGQSAEGSQAAAPKPEDKQPAPQEPEFVPPPIPGKLPKKPVERKPGEVNAGDFIELRDGAWHYCPSPSEDLLSRETTAIAVALEGFGYDPETGARNQQVKNIPIAQFWQDAKKSPFRHSRKEVAEALRRFKVAPETIKATVDRLPPDPVAD